MTVNPKLLNSNLRKVQVLILEGVKIIGVVKKYAWSEMVSEMHSDMLYILNFFIMDNSNTWVEESY